MGVLFDLSLYSPSTLLGLVWTLVVFYLLYNKNGARISSSKWTLLATLPAALFAVPIVAQEVEALTLLTGGVTTLDGHVGYASAHITAFAEALGQAGRERYAYFQLGLDTLAPPALAGFVLTVGRNTIAFEKIRKLFTIVVSVYFISVLFANALMPVYMLNYPAQNGLSDLLYVLLPILDGAKYAMHAVAWIVILSSGAVWFVKKYVLKSKNELGLGMGL